jgi:hypothetical protein
MDAILRLEWNTESAREDVGLKVAKDKKTSVSDRIIIMINRKTAERWQVPL